MGTNEFTLIAGTYALEEDALADYHDVRAVYDQAGYAQADIRHPTAPPTFDAAVVSKYTDGKVYIVERVEEPTRQGGAAGLVTGLAAGALVALFPEIAIGPGLAVGGSSGTAIGATAGHVTRGMRRGDLNDLGELLDRGQSGLVVVTEPDLVDRVEAAITRGKDIVHKPVGIDVSGLKTDIDTL
jgi:uncharacterized membrane protein